MRKFLVASITAAASVLAVTAQAAETSGTIRHVNTKADTITLNDGKVYVLPEGIEAESVKIGEKVKITFVKNKGQNRVSKLSVNAK